MHGLVRCKPEHRCSRTRGEDASFIDIKIKPQIGNDTRVVNEVIPGCVGWGFWDLEKVRKLSSYLGRRRLFFRAGRDQTTFVRFGCRTLFGLRADDVKAVCIERLCLSLSSCWITFKLKKVNKSFVPEPISCFFLDSLCLFHISVSWVCNTINVSEISLTI